MVLDRKYTFLGMIIYLLLNLLLSAGCASVPTTEESDLSQTMYSDLPAEALNRSQYYQKLGENFYFQSEFSNAIEVFKLSLLHDSTNRQSRFSLAKAYILNQQDHLAMIELEKYFSTTPDFKGVDDKDIQLISTVYERSKSYEKLIDVQSQYYQQSGSKWSLWKIYEYELFLGRIENAFKALDQLKGVGEELFKIDLAQAEIYEHEKKWPGVIAALNIAEQRKPLDEFILRKKIMIYFELKDWISLNQVGEKYNKYHPYNLDVSEKWSYSAIQTKDYETALIELKKQKKLYPDSVGLEFKIAHVLFLMKDYKSAEEAYADLYELTQSDQSVFYLAEIHMLNNRYNEAAEKMQFLASTSEYYPTSQIELSRLEWKNEQKDLSLNRMRTAHLLRPDSLELYLEYAQYLIWAKNYVEAIALLEKANMYYPQNDRIKLLSAYNHFKLNNQRQFQKDIRAAIALAPNNAEIYDVLSELWYEKQKPVEEIKYLAQKAIALNSKSKNVKPILAWVLLQQDQLSQAAALFEEFYDQSPNEVFYTQSLAELYSRSSLPGKTNSYQTKAAELKLSNVLKNEIEFFSFQNQVQKTDVQKSKSRLPASLDQ